MNNSQISCFFASNNRVTPGLHQWPAPRSSPSPLPRDLQKRHKKAEEEFKGMIKDLDQFTIPKLEGMDNVVFGFGLFFGGLLQLIGGLHERARNNVFGYTGFIVYGRFWMSWAASLFLKVIGNDIPINPHAVQAMLSLMGTFTVVMFLCTFVMMTEF